MTFRRSSILFVLFFITLPSCSDSGGGSQGSTFTQHLEADRSLLGVTQDEWSQICDAWLGDTAARITEEEYCETLATLRSDETQACTETQQSCLDRDLFTEERSCRYSVRGECTATAGELEACLQSRAAQYDVAFGQLSCEDPDDTALESSVRAALSGSDLDDPCIALREDCPSFFGRCDPDHNYPGAACTCETEAGSECDPDNPPPFADCACTLSDDHGGGGGGGGGGTPYRFVLVEDLSQSASGIAPGADIDAIVVAKSDGSIMPATTVEDFGGIGNGDFTDPNQALGVPDSNCEVQNFFALGGADAGGYIVVGFATSGGDGTFTGGDSIIVSEIGSTMCGQFDDDPYSVSVSVSKDLSTFVEIATNVLGNNPITVPSQ